jgi:hypothetical protein
MATETYICAALEEDRFMARALAIGKCTHCLGRFVRVGSEKIVESFKAELF